MGRAEDLFKIAVAEGESFIDQLIAARQSEELFIDYKRSADNGQGTSLAFEDRKNLSKAISGFGISAGGIVIWGGGLQERPKAG